jgi:hypothetical protein
MDSEDFAITIGFSHYGFLPSLRAPESDARYFARWLDEAGVPKVWYIRPDRVPVSQDDFDKLFAPILESPQDQSGRIGRRLYVYTSGDGVNTRDGDLALVLPGASSNFVPAISLSAYADYFRLSGLFEEIVLFADCIRSSSIVVQPSVPLWHRRDESSASSTAFYGFSMQALMQAYQSSPYGHEVPGSRFTQALLDGLKGAAVDNEGRVTSASSCNVSSNRTDRLKLLSSNFSVIHPSYSEPA